MADAKLTALSAIGTLGFDDLFYVVDDPGGTPLSRKVTGENLKTYTLIADQYSADAVDREITFNKSRNATVGSHTIVQDGDDLGTIRWQGSNGTTFDTAALIIGEVGGTPGVTTDMPGRITIFTTPDGSATPVERMRISPGGQISIGTTPVFGDQFQNIGVSDATCNATFARYSADANGNFFNFYKSRNAGIGGHTIIQNNDVIGTIQCWGSNGSGFDLPVHIDFAVDGVPGATTDMPGRIQFYTAPDGASTGVERMRIDASSNVNIGSAATGARRLHVNETNATTNAVTYVERLQVQSSGAPANNIGVGQEYSVETAADNHELGVVIDVVAVDTTATSEDFSYRIKTMTAGAAAATSLSVSLPGTVYPQGQIFGLTMSNAADTSNDITIAAGECVDETGVWNMTVAAITKQIDAVWSVGTGAGGINIISVADNTWYEVIVIGREDTRVVDVMFSTTGNRATLPTNYTHKRRIGWVRRLTGTLALFTQIDDYVTLTTQINDSSTAITATAAAITLTAPPSSIVRFRATLQMTALALAAEAVTVFSEIPEGNVTPAGSTGIASLGAGGQNATSANNDSTNAGHFELRVSATSTIEHDSALGSGAAGTFDISTFGWIDHRRRLSAT